jgi:hypothetical protein
VSFILLTQSSVEEAGLCCQLAGRQDRRIDLKNPDHLPIGPKRNRATVRK